jgi:hypothetical protein
LAPVAAGAEEVRPATHQPGVKQVLGQPFTHTQLGGFMQPGLRHYQHQHDSHNVDEPDQLTAYFAGIT